MRIALAWLTFAMLLPDSALACQVCFGNPDSRTSAGLVMGVYVLLAVTVFVLSCFAYFIFNLWKRSRLHAAQAEVSSS